MQQRNASRARFLGTRSESFSHARERGTTVVLLLPGSGAVTRESVTTFAAEVASHLPSLDVRAAVDADACARTRDDAAGSAPDTLAEALSAAHEDGVDRLLLAPATDAADASSLFAGANAVLRGWRLIPEVRYLPTPLAGAACKDDFGPAHAAALAASIASTAGDWLQRAPRAPGEGEARAQRARERGAHA